MVHAVQHGQTNPQIASRRGVSVDAIKYHVANALAKLGLENKRALRGWFRAPRDSALGRRERRMNETVALGTVGQISRSASDVGAAERFYGEMLGLRHLYSFPGMTFFDLDGTRLFITEQSELPEGESVLYLTVSNIGSAYETLQARGLEFTHAPHLIHKHEDGTEEWMAFFNDPDGRPLAIMEQVRG